MTIFDNEHLPKHITDIYGIKDILLAIDPELIILRDDISNLKKELYINTTEKYIKRWEEDFNLTFDSSLNLKERRLRILNKLKLKKTLTWTNLRKLIQANISNPQIYIINDSKNYFFRIMIQDPTNFQQLEKTLKKAKPAYLTFDIIVTEYFRRCGTFRFGEALL